MDRIEINRVEIIDAKEMYNNSHKIKYKVVKIILFLIMIVKLLL